MPDRSYELQGVRIFECAPDGSQPQNDRDAVKLISAAWEHRARFVVIPAGRLGDDFFRLKTRIAGEIIQKFVTYGVRVAIIGNISRHLEESSALRDFVYECNRGTQVWFLASAQELEERLERHPQET